MNIPLPSDSNAKWAEYYTSIGWAITPLEKASKRPINPGWPDTPTRDPAEAATYWRDNPVQGIGVVLGKSGLLSLDVDNVEEARTALAVAGINLDQLLENPSIPRIEGDPKKAKLLFRQPEGITFSLKTLPGKDKKALELRGNGQQDALPPSVHPSGKRYVWLRPPNGEVPPLPDTLQQLWMEWDQWEGRLEGSINPAKAQRLLERDIREYETRSKGNGDGWDEVRRQIRQQLPLADFLAQMGSEPRGQGKYSCPFHPPDRNPSFAVYGDLWIDFHGPTPVGEKTRSGYGVGDVIDLYQFTKNLDSPGRATVELARDFRLAPPKPPKPEYTLTDDGNADRLVSQHGKDLHYCFERGWMIWDGKRWAEDKTDQVRRWAVTVVKKIPDEAQGEPDRDRSSKILKWAGSSLSDQRLGAMIASTQSKLPLPILLNEFDKDPFLFNVSNGTINLRTGDLRPHRREDKITKLAPVEYYPDARCPRWLDFLNRVMDGQSQLIGYLQRAIGYSLTGDTQEQCYFLLYGTGANGKTVLLATLRSLMGDYGQESDFNTFLLQKTDGPRNDIAKLTGSRLVVASEVETGRRLAEVVVKELTGGDYISARFLHHEFFEFKPQFKLFLAANHKPIIYGTDHAIWRRTKLIPFAVTIPISEQDRRLTQKLQEELPGILAWAVEGCVAWQKVGLDQPEAVTAATGSYRDEMDWLGGFLDECCVEESTAQVRASQLYQAYKDWCDQSGENPINQRSFSLRLGERGLEKRRLPSGLVYRGIGLLVKTTPANPEIANM